MKVELIPVDSDVWGRNVLSLSDISERDDIRRSEQLYVAEYQPVYVSVRLPLDSLCIIAKLEEHGFSFVECQIRLVAQFKSDFDITRFTFLYEKVETLQKLDDVISIARSAITHDRFSVDKQVPRGFSGRRYEAYVRQSYLRTDEEVWRLYDPKRDQTVGFRTHRRTSDTEALLLLGGIHPDHVGTGAGVISSYYCFNQMRKDGVKRAITHISVLNKPIFDLEVSRLGFRYQAAFAVLRKVYF